MSTLKSTGEARASSQAIPDPETAGSFAFPVLPGPAGINGKHSMSLISPPPVYGKHFLALVLNMAVLVGCLSGTAVAQAQAPGSKTGSAPSPSPGASNPGVSKTGTGSRGHV